MDIYLSPTGNDAWSGRIPEPNSTGDDGPKASIDAALQHLRGYLTPPRKPARDPEQSIAMIDGPVTIHLRAGRYEIAKPIHLRGSDRIPLCIQSYHGEQAVIDGGSAITDWQETSANGVPCWVADVPGLADGSWPFKQLFVNGQRATTARLPKTGSYVVADPLAAEGQQGWGQPGTNRFVAEAGSIDPSWRNLTDIDVLLFHFWIEERMPIGSYDGATGIVTSPRTSRAPLVKAWNCGGATYVLENVFEALTEPGECYIDRQAGRVYYVPRADETLATSEAFAPRLPVLVFADGDHGNDQCVEWLQLRDLTFRHGAAVWPGDPSFELSALHGDDQAGGRYRGPKLAGSAQAAYDVPGALYFRGAHGCVVENCTIEHVGWYGLELHNGCSNCRVVGNTIRDTGAGGMRIGGVDADGPRSGRCGRNRITDNHCYDGGHYFTCGVGLLATHCHSNLISHNHIHDYYYTAISVGWLWGYAESVSRDNTISYNHLHDLGKGVLSDMGGIYTLGPQPGTHIHHNHIHDIHSAAYGGWAIYPDEGSGAIVIENNVSHDTSNASFHQHFGRENIVRNNIWAFGGEGCIALSKVEPHLSLTFHHNIVLSDGQSIYSSGYGWDPSTDRSPMNSFANTCFDCSGRQVAIANKAHTTAAAEDGRDWAGWQAAGHDQGSQWVDPGFVDVAKRDFTLKSDSPALKLGFKPIDISTVGPRPPEQRC
ncbi:MAG: right-handed parallel beta-helix repeat-containing protein [Planctomycetota bacterium]|jgi:parallel beta-helix repeat protein|nr:right-handed parallel beta-helix repeat-containing protein [Planctomycetota bacterium]